MDAVKSMSTRMNVPQPKDGEDGASGEADHAEVEGDIINTSNVQRSDDSSVHTALQHLNTTVSDGICIAG